MTGTAIITGGAGIIEPGDVADLPRLQKKGESGMQRYLSARGLKPGG
jgi:hypothetical protein